MIIQYNDTIMDHFDHPQQVGCWDESDNNIITGRAGSLAHGEMIQLQLKLDNNNKIVDTRMKVYGNPSTIAASSFTAEWLVNKEIPQTTTLNYQFISAALQLPQARLHCAVLAETALKNALKLFNRATVL